MTVEDFSAVEQARGLLLRPTQLGALRKRALPEGMRTLLRVAAGDEAILETAARRTGDRPEVLREACQFYVQQVLLDDASDSYRTLGANGTTPAVEIKAHYGLLMRWMHPDRNPDGWDVVFADRVTRAWNDLRTSDRRSAYDLAFAAATAVTDAEDWTGQAAPYQATRAPVLAPRPVLSPSWIPAQPASPTFALPVQARWIAGTAIASLAALLLILAWPQREQRDDFQSAIVANTPTDRPIAEAAPAPTAERVPKRGAEPSSVAAGLVASTSTSTSPGAEVSPPAGAVAGSAATRVNAIPQPLDVAVPRDNSGSLQRPDVAEPPPRPATEDQRLETLSAATLPDNEGIRTVAASELRAAPTPRAAETPEVEDSPVDALSESASAQPAGIAPANTAPVVAEEAEETVARPPNFDEASLLIGRFAHAYQKGDVDALSALFTEDARSQGGGLAQIRQAYDRLFAQTTARSISIRDIQWRVEDEHARATGKFEISQARDSQAKHSVSRGTIRFDIEQHQDRLLIARLEHVDRQR